MKFFRTAGIIASFLILGVVNEVMLCPMRKEAMLAMASLESKAPAAKEEEEEEEVAIAPVAAAAAKKGCDNRMAADIIHFIILVACILTLFPAMGKRAKNMIRRR